MSMAVQRQNLGRFRLRGRYSHKKTFGAVLQLPPTLGRIALYVKDQGLTQYCTAAGNSVAGSYLYGQDMSFEWQTAKEGQVAGQPIFNGAEPNVADTASEEYGFLPVGHSPRHFETDGWQLPAQWQQYPEELDQVAREYRDFAPYNVYPDYASIKNALAGGHADNSVVIARGFWYQSWNNPIGGIVTAPGDKPITRHEYLFIDYKVCPDGVERLVAQLSQGTGFGNGSEVYMDPQCVAATFRSPGFNGLGCVILRRGGPNPVVTQITLLQRLLIVLGQVYDKLRGL